MTNPIIIHSFQDLVDAINAHDTSLEKPYLRLSFESVSALGMGVVSGYLELLRERYPDWAPYFAIDCGDCPGYVLSALRHGVTHIFYQGSTDQRQRLQQASKFYGGAITPC